MSAKVIYPNGSVEIIVSASEYLSLSNYGGGIAQIYYLIITTNFPPAYKLQQTLEDGAVTLGPFAIDTTVKIEANNSKVIYDYGSSPDIGTGDASTLGGNPASYYTNADNLSAGTIADARLPATISSDTSGNAATATALSGFSIEEDTFTPVAAGGTTAGAGTYTVQFGSYQKVNNWVHFRIHIKWTAHTGTGQLTITGLPYTSNATRTAAVTIIPADMTYTGDSIGAFVNASSNTIFFYNVSNGSALGALSLDSDATIYAQGSYEITVA